jgi:hypothetical protein
MNFQEFYESYSPKTDKGTYHNYIVGYYNNEFNSLKESDITLLEIGILKGESTKLFRDWFTNAELWALDNNAAGAGVFDIDGVNILWEDAYDDSVVSKFDNNYFDYIIDDGPHTLESQKLTIIKWLPKIKSGGKLIIEDIFDFSYIEELKNTGDLDLIDSFKVFDLRESKGRFDDIIIEITKK